MNDRISALAARVRYQALRDYLVARRWQSMPSRISYAAIYRSPGAGDVEVQIPLDPDLADYADAITLAARRLASFEGRSVEQVLRGLLQPRSDSPERAHFVGKVVELSGAPNSAGQLEGDVILQIQADDQLLKVRVTLAPDAYALAGAAHLAQQYVSVHGQLHRGRRIHGLKDPTGFTVLPA